MPLSRRRKKKGKVVKGHRPQITVDPNKESNVTLQDLINVYAYQEYKEAGKLPSQQTTSVVDEADKITPELLEELDG